jgi:hypothetical protein
MKTPAIVSAAFLLAGIVFTGANATHILGGQITATAVSNQNYSYQIKVTIYSDGGSPVTFSSFELDLGFGRTVYEQEILQHNWKALNDDSLVFVNTFLLNQTYPGPGEYLLYAREFNRTSYIVNMNNSVNTPFYMETKLLIDPLTGNNSTPVLADPLSFDANVKSSYVYNIGAIDPDGDSLSYALVVPKQTKEKFVDGYYAPHRLGISSAAPPAREDGTLPALLDFENGQLIWNAPAYGGSYAIAFQVKEWRKIEGTWKEIGYVTRDFTLLVQDTINHTNGGDYITATEKETDQQDIILFPNPTDGQFVLNVNKNWYNSTLTIQDMLGRKIYGATLLSDRTSYFDLPHLSSGMYVLQLQKGLRQHSLSFVKK